MARPAAPRRSRHRGGLPRRTRGLSGQPRPRRPALRARPRPRAACRPHRRRPTRRPAGGRRCRCPRRRSAAGRPRRPAPRPDHHGRPSQPDPVDVRRRLRRPRGVRARAPGRQRTGPRRRSRPAPLDRRARHGVRPRPHARPRHRCRPPAGADRPRHRTPGRPAYRPHPALPGQGRGRLSRRDRRRTGGGRATPPGRARRHRRTRLPDLLPHRRHGRRPHQGPRDPRRRTGIRCGVAGQLPARDLRSRPDALRPAHGAVLLAVAGPAARHRHRRRVGPAHRDLREGAGPVRRRAGHLRVDDGQLPRPPRDPRRRGGAGDAAGRGRRDGQGVPAHLGSQRPRRHRRPARAAGQRPQRTTPRPHARPRRTPRRPPAPHRPAPLRRGPVQLAAARPDAGRGELDRVPHEPVRQGRRRGARAAQARHPRHPDAVGDGPRRRRGPPRRPRGHRPRRPRRRPARRRDDVPDDPHDAHPRLLPDREPGSARAHRQVRARSRSRTSSPTSRCSGPVR